MKKLIIILCIWSLFGAFNWTTTMAMCKKKFPLQTAEGGSRKWYGISAFTAMCGPLATLPMMVISNLYEHGLEWK